MPFVKKIIPALSLAFLIPMAFSQCTSVPMTAEQDHQRVMDLLHIQPLRPRALRKRRCSECGQLRRSKGRAVFASA
jgi:hypothetical protein